MKPDARTPDEGAMLAFVEGELSLTDEVAFRRGLRHAPQVLARLEGMRRDKALLRASMLRQPLVPAALVASVDEALDRAALLGASEMGAGEAAWSGSIGAATGAVIGAPRLSTRVVESRWRVLSRPPVRAAMAMAATIALVTGGVVLVSRVVPGAGSGGRGAGTLAQGQSGAADATRDQGVERVIASGESGSAVDGGGVALRDVPSDGGGLTGHDPRIALATGDGPGAGSGAEPVVPVDDPVIEAPGAAFPVATTRLVPGGVARRDVMALAEQHRLALRVSADEPSQVIAALEAAVGAPASSGWRVVGDAPATLASSLGVTIEPSGEAGGGDGPAWGVPGSGEPAQDEPGFDPGRVPDGPMGEPGRREEARVPGVSPDDAWLLRETESALAVYLAEVDMSEEGLAALDRDLRRAGQRVGARAGFAALEDPLDRVIGRRDLLAPAGDVLWWHHPPREWSRRTLVPVVVERK